MKLIEIIILINLVKKANNIYMSCDIKLKSPIYRIIYTSLLERKKTIYIFVGEIRDKSIKKF